MKVDLQDYFISELPNVLPPSYHKSTDVLEKLSKVTFHSAFNICRFLSSVEDERRDKPVSRKRWR